MNFGSILMMVFIAIAFIGWPIVGKYSGASGAWIGTIMLIATTLVTGTLSLKEMARSSFPPTKAVAMLIAAGMMNGLAVYLYARKSSSPTVSTATFIVTVTVLMIVFAPILDWLFNGSIPSTRKVFGFACAAFSVYLLSR